jgi:hypothetical protein
MPSEGRRIRAEEGKRVPMSIVSVYASGRPGSACADSAHCQVEVIVTGTYTSFGTPADRSLHPHTLRPPAIGSDSTGVLGVRPNSWARVSGSHRDVALADPVIELLIKMFPLRNARPSLRGPSGHTGVAIEPKRSDTVWRRPLASIL